MTTEKVANGARLDLSLGEVQARAAAAASQLLELARDNAGAVVETGKALQEGLRGMGEDGLAEGRQAVAALCEDLSQVVGLRSVGDALQFQALLAQRQAERTLDCLLRRNIALISLSSRAFTPLSERVQANLAVIDALT